ncbi:PAE7 [Symbiodinium sp. CCMP2592]|nr:PAE7 [Symbiodinium sp. CCMP2592]
MVKLLLQAGADKDKSPGLPVPGTGTPLQVVCSTGDVEIARLLIEAGADKEKVSRPAPNTPLQIACSKGYEDLVKLLLEARADADRALPLMDGGTLLDSQGTPLQTACREGHVAIVRMLLEAGASRNKVSRSCLEKPLQLAFASRHLDIARLVSKGLQEFINALTTQSPPLWPKRMPPLFFPDVDRFIRAMYFPPLTPAKFRSADGELHAVVSLTAFEALRRGEAPAPPPNNATSKAEGTRRPSREPPAPPVPSPRLWWLAAIFPLAAWLGKETLSSGAVPGLAERLELGDSARCLDGSPVNLYLARGVHAGRKKWVINFQGGGWCTTSPSSASAFGYSHEEDVAHPDLCEDRAKGYHGSSSTDRDFRDFEDKGYLSGNPSVNPMMYNWNRVMIRNCDGTMFLSSHGELSTSSGRLHFRGRDNAFAAIEVLLQHGLADASDVLLAGCSAGAVAAVVLADELRRRVEEAVAARGGRVFVAALADSGVFPSWAAAEAPPGTLHFPSLAELFALGNVSGALPQGCLEQGHGWRCLLLGTALPFVRTPAFALQSLVDSWSLTPRPTAGALASLNGHMSELIVGSIKGPHGAALDNCVHHCKAWGEIFWGGVSNSEAFERWFNQRRWEWARGEAPGEGQGWPLLPSTSPAFPGCYPGQAGHVKWHSSVRRLGNIDSALEGKKTGGRGEGRRGGAIVPAGGGTCQEVELKASRKDTCAKLKKDLEKVGTAFNIPVDDMEIFFQNAEEGSRQKWLRDDVVLEAEDVRDGAILTVGVHGDAGQTSLKLVAESFGKLHVVSSDSWHREMHLNWILLLMASMSCQNSIAVKGETSYYFAHSRAGQHARFVVNYVLEGRRECGLRRV